LTSRGLVLGSPWAQARLISWSPYACFAVVVAGFAARVGLDPDTHRADVKALFDRQYYQQKAQATQGSNVEWSASWWAAGYPPPWHAQQAAWYSPPVVGNAPPVSDLAWQGWQAQALAAASLAESALQERIHALDQREAEVSRLEVTLEQREAEVDHRGEARRERRRALDQREAANEAPAGDGETSQRSAGGAAARRGASARGSAERPSELRAPSTAVSKTPGGARGSAERPAVQARASKTARGSAERPSELRAPSTAVSRTLGGAIAVQARASKTAVAPRCGSVSAASDKDPRTLTRVSSPSSRKVTKSAHLH